MVEHHHFLFVTFPAQGHINPALQLARRLTTINGVHVTFLINTHTRRSMIEVPNYKNFTLSEFSDGYDNGHTFEQAVEFNIEFKRHATQALKDIIITNSSVDSRQPAITCLVYCLFVPWAAKVALELHVQPVFLWIQPAIVFDIYYYYFNHIDGVEKKINDYHESESGNKTWSIRFPKLSTIPFTVRDIPSLITPTNKIATMLTLYLQEHVETLAKEAKPKVLVNTFNALEPEALSAISDIDLIAVGPLDIPSGSSAAVNLFKSTDRNKYISWLNTKPESSVVYISFGSLSTLSDKHVEGIKRGLLASGKHSLWVMRTAAHHHQNEDKNTMMMMMTVSWCNQNEVLSHPSVGCFLTHCGWNSTLESMIAGKPIVAFPHFGDQVTNAMLVELWKIGVRVNANEMNNNDDDDLARAGDEIQRCLEIVLGNGGRGEEIRRNVLEYKTLALDAFNENNGSSDKNLRTFVEQLSTSII